MAKDEEEDDLLPDKDAAKGFYAKYEPKEILGRGISSTVRRCIEKETGKEFAAKIIDLGAATESGDTNPYHMLEATRQEISILRQVMGHPYIIDLQDVFESDAFVFLVFELCPKGELFDYLTSVVTLSEKKTRTIMRQIFEGVEYIHAKNIVHRDLKPENILLDENHNVKITDFGFARQLKDNEKLSDLCGTPGYLAPETLKCNMFEGSPGYSQEVDIWACGVIMFTLLVGCPPFWHRKQMVMLRNIMEGKYSFTSPEWADISEDPKDLIRKCLVVDPAKRITVKEVLKHPFFNQMLFEQNIDGLKRSLSTKSRRMSRINDIALVLCAAEPSIDGRTTYQLKSQNIRNLTNASQSYNFQTTNTTATTNIVNTNLYLNHNNKFKKSQHHDQQLQPPQQTQQQQSLQQQQHSNNSSLNNYNNKYNNNFIYKNNSNNKSNNYSTHVNNMNSMQTRASTLTGSTGASNAINYYLKHSIAKKTVAAAGGGYTDARHITQLAPFTLQQQQRLQQQHQKHRQQKEQFEKQYPPQYQQQPQQMQQLYAEQVPPTQHQYNNQHHNLRSNLHHCKCHAHQVAQQRQHSSAMATSQSSATTSPYTPATCSCSVICASKCVSSSPLTTPGSATHAQRLATNSTNNLLLAADAASYAQQLRKQSRFNPRKKFQFVILVVRAMIRIRRLRYTAEPLRVEDAIRDPYRVKVLRKVIDGCAFRVYGHWVKKGEGQNRAALFENTPRTELHTLYINNLSR